MTDDIRALLDEHFPQFEDRLKEKIASVATIRDFVRDEVMMYSGRFFKSTILIVGGRVKLYRESDDGKEYFMYYIEPGNACALSMICAARNQASEITAVSVEDTRVIQVPLEIMDDLMREYKSWYYFVLETYRSRFEELLIVIDQVAFKHMDERLENYLFRQFTEFNTRHLEITHQQIANDLNSTREVVSRLLKKMEQSGKIKLHRNEIEMINLFI